MVRAREAERARLVHDALVTRDIADQRVLAAMNAVPREHFVAPELADVAYQDRALPIGNGQTISQPYIVALMIQALELDPDDRVLEIGTGSGYGAAVLSRIAAEVYTVERHADLAEQANRRLTELGYVNVVVRHGDGAAGWPSHAPYDGIVLTATARAVPDALCEQLSVGGRLVLPVGDQPGPQKLLKLTKTRSGTLDETDLASVQFVPLRPGRTGDPRL